MYRQIKPLDLMAVSEVESVETNIPKCISPRQYDKVLHKYLRKRTEGRRNHKSSITEVT
jgi:hypothetical protein